MKKKIIINPFNIQFIAILAVLIIYSLGWSELTQPLKVPLILFLAFVLVSLLIFSKIYNTYFPPRRMLAFKFKEPTKIWILIGLLSMAAEFIYEGAVPILELVVFKNSYNYVDFAGIPGFHVFAVTYTSFLGLWLWDMFLQDKRWFNFLLAGFFMSYPILLFNRGGFIFNIVSAVFILMYRVDEIQLSAKKIAVLFVAVIGFTYAFGVFGNLRSFGASTSNNSDYFSESGYISDVGKATKEFQKSTIPKEFFWMYLYVSTPIANLQNIVEKNEPMNSPEAFMTESVLPDFIGKRIAEGRGIQVADDKLIAKTFNVSTFFADAYKTMGFFGLILIVFYFAFFIFGFTYLYSMLNTQRVVGMSILFTVAIFCLFSNMMTFSGLSFQLIYPVLFGLYKKIQ